MKKKQNKTWQMMGLCGRATRADLSSSFFCFFLLIFDLFYFIFFFKVWLVNCSTQKSPSAFRQSTLYISNLEEGLFVMWKIPFSFSPKWTTNTRWLGSCRIDLFFCSSSIQRMTKRTCWPVDLSPPSIQPHKKMCFMFGSLIHSHVCKFIQCVIFWFDAPTVQHFSFLFLFLFV